MNGINESELDPQQMLFWHFCTTKNTAEILFLPRIWKQVLEASTIQWTKLLAFFLEIIYLRKVVKSASGDTMLALLTTVELCVLSNGTHGERKRPPGRSPRKWRKLMNDWSDWRDRSLKARGKRTRQIWARSRRTSVKSTAPHWKSELSQRNFKPSNASKTVTHNSYS